VIDEVIDFAGTSPFREREIQRDLSSIRFHLGIASSSGPTISAIWIKEIAERTKLGAIIWRS
jgi:hypothetical protein